jgi:hypothetical protein
MTSNNVAEEIDAWTIEWLRDVQKLGADQSVELAASWRARFGIRLPSRVGYSVGASAPEPVVAGDGARFRFQRALVHSPGASVFVFSPYGTYGVEGTLAPGAESASVVGLARLRSETIVAPANLSWAFLASLDPCELFLTPVATVSSASS